jgi:thioredoxin-like negative regulator of GroEL
MSDAPTVHALVSSAVQARQTGDLLFATHYYEQALELAPDQVDIRLDAAAARLGSGDPTKAIELLGLDLPHSERPAPLPPSLR